MGLFARACVCACACVFARAYVCVCVCMRARVRSRVIRNGIFNLFTRRIVKIRQLPGIVILIAYVRKSTKLNYHN